MAFETIQGGCDQEDQPRAREIALEINRRASTHPVFRNAKREGHPDQNTAWRIAPEPFCISEQFYGYLGTLGNHLLGFYRAANKLYFESFNGRQPRWVAEYLDQGKPQALIEYSRMNRSKQHLPRIIRPDIIVTDEGRAVCCELDAIPGGIGFVGSMAREYAHHGFNIVGGEFGMVEGFARMIRDIAVETPDPTLAIVISEESGDYWSEMEWMGPELERLGLRTLVVHPEQLYYTDDGFKALGQPIDFIYRFFELFDLKNIPKTELIQYAAKKQKVRVTPPFKPYLEEKSLFALFHHPGLREYWLAELGAEAFEMLTSLFPKTWILDPRPLPPYGVIPGLCVNGRPATRWDELYPASKKGRQYVVKPSGFSALAWGSRGISFGHDLSSEEWVRTLEKALAAFDQGTPYLLQEFHKPAKVDVRYYNFAKDEIVPMAGRARFCPYFYVVEGKAELAGVLVTIVPPDKLAIHGMVDSVMVPARVDLGSP